MAQLFGAAKPKGPDNETLAAQRRSEQRATEQRNKQDSELGARRRLLAARAGRSGQSQTLYSGTGETGISLKSQK